MEQDEELATIETDKVRALRELSVAASIDKAETLRLI